MRGPNDDILRADVQRCRQPLPSGWQLCYRVNNFRPAAQLVAVEQQQPDGSWQTLQACHTIEFQSRTARPRGGLTREHAAPIKWNGDLSTLPRLRLVLRGLGEVKIEAIELFDGRARVRPAKHRQILGRPAPRRGLPKLDWSKNQDSLRLTAWRPIR
jgi:hypothetical protein